MKITCERLLLKVKLNLSKACKSCRVWVKLIGNFFSKYCSYLNGCFWKCNIFKHSSKEVASLKIYKISSWLLLRLTISVLFINMSYWCSIDVVRFNVNLIALFKLNPRTTKTSHMWNNHLIFFVCLYNRYSLALEVLYERSRTTPVLFEDSLNLLLLWSILHYKILEISLIIGCRPSAPKILRLNTILLFNFEVVVTLKL